jgi:hypothetical protein
MIILLSVRGLTVQPIGAGELPTLGWNNFEDIGALDLDIRKFIFSIDYG